ncbi:hypothetical protein J5A54_00610 [Prevotella melaninogenica]|uniref:hypothetical protein n=1 Tax=Prevotella melaninogenica TaxID=28132 RepID=UPI001BA5A328|nr:hypothetical protein [Prevotella melaninogenica]QUB63256.1 hypothetical protein J5A54_00610 [Prevotella melaninogenica]
MKKVLLYLLALPVVMLLLASCHSEEDDFIDKPDPKSLIIKGVAKTPDGQPIPNIEIKLDYMIMYNLYSTKVYHKAKATTDKDGNYIMFFNLSDKEIKSLTTDSAEVGTSYSLQMTLDLSKLDDKVYLLPTDITVVRPLSKKELFYSYYIVPGRLQKGQVYEQNIFIPRKQLVKVRIETNGTINEKDSFAICNKVWYGMERQIPIGFNVERGYLEFYQPIKLKNTHSQTVQISCAVEENSKLSLYRLPDGEYNYKEYSSEVEVPVMQTGGELILRTH